MQGRAIGVRAAVIADSDLIQEFIDLAIASGVLGVRPADAEFLRRKVGAMRRFYFRRRIDPRIFAGAQGEYHRRRN